MKVESRLIIEGFSRTQEVVVQRDDGQAVAAIRVRLLGEREDGAESYEVETSVRSEEPPQWGAEPGAPVMWKVGKEHAWLPPVGP